MAKSSKPFGDDREAEDEAIGSALVDPADDLVGDMIRRADEGRARRCGIERDFAQRQVLLARRLLDAVGGGAEIVVADIADIRERLVERIDAEIMMVEEAAEIEQRLLDGDEIADRLIFRLRFLLPSRRRSARCRDRCRSSAARRPCAIALCLTCL